MKKTLKIFGAVVAVLIVLVGVGIYYLATNLDSIVANVIEKQGSAATGTPVRVGAVSIDLREATGSISSLTIANPPGYSRDNAIEFGQLGLRLDAGSLFSDPIVVENIDVTDAEMHIEQLGADNNLQALLANLKSGSGEAPAEDESEGPRVIIRRFALTGARASLTAPDFDEQRVVEVPDIVLTDVGGKSRGATGRELAVQVLEPVVRRTLESAAVQAAKERLREEVQEKAGEIAGGLLDRLGIDGGEDESADDAQQE
jgi:hypothetical protein